MAYPFWLQAMAAEAAGDGQKRKAKKPKKAKGRAKPVPETVAEPAAAKAS